MRKILLKRQKGYFIIYAFTPTKDYSPKRQFFQYSFSIHYGVKFKSLTTCKTVSIETPTQHSIYVTLILDNFALTRPKPQRKISE